MANRKQGGCLLGVVTVLSVVIFVVWGNHPDNTPLCSTDWGKVDYEICTKQRKIHSGIGAHVSAYLFGKRCRTELMPLTNLFNSSNGMICVFVPGHDVGDQIRFVHLEQTNPNARGGNWQVNEVFVFYNRANKYRTAYVGNNRRVIRFKAHGIKKRSDWHGLEGPSNM